MRTYTDEDARKLTARGLEEATNRLCKKDRELTDGLIESGFGNRTFSDLRQIVGVPKVTEYLAIADALHVLHEEKQRRLRYHGTTKRTPASNVTLH